MKMKHLIVLLCVFFLPAFGCVNIPDTSSVEYRSQKFDVRPTYSLCHPELVASNHLSASLATNGLNPTGFSVLNWNIQKENQAGWESDLVRFSENADILIIQEAFLTEKLRGLLNPRTYYWQLVTAFEYQDVKTGVLTAATAAPDFICPQRATEPLIRVPKTILITRYPLANTHHSLMIANIHMINFAPDTTAYRDQAQQMMGILQQHQGPMILSGDFNIWNGQRLAIIESVTGRLGLKLAEFKTDLATTSAMPWIAFTTVD
ncbi:MAG: endonuclease/exonuclease/phosphatase family protein [Desulfobacterales bacterium]|jgi:endonuclease/exonuclease/phosphatase (EEP) superfamily protein YafD